MKKGVMLTFDFKIEDLKKYYSFTSPKNAYKVVGEYLVKNGFEKTKDSDYVSYSNNLESSIEILDAFSEKFKWFTPSLTKLSVTPITQIWDLSHEYKSLYNNKEFMMKKEAQYNAKIKEKEEVKKPSLLNRLSKKKDDLEKSKSDNKNKTKENER